MKKNLIKIGGSAVAITLAGILSFQLVTNHEMIADASVGTLSGIEQIRDRIMGKDRAYNILEIVPDKSESELGYLIQGSEPWYYFDGMKLDGTEFADGESHAIPSVYSVGNAILTYEDCSLWDETNHCWMSVSDKLNLFDSENKKQSFMAFMIDRYNEKMGVPEFDENGGRNYLLYSSRLAGNNTDLADMGISGPSVNTFQTGFLTFGPGGNYQMDLEPISKDAVPEVTDGNAYYYGKIVNTITTDVELNDITKTLYSDKMFYKRVKDYGSDGNVYYGYVLVGDYDAMLMDIEQAKAEEIGNAQIALNYYVSGLTGNQINSGNVYTIIPSLVGYGYPASLDIAQIEYEISADYFVEGQQEVVDHESHGYHSLDEINGFDWGLNCSLEGNQLKLSYQKNSGIYIYNLYIRAKDQSVVLTNPKYTVKSYDNFVKIQGEAPVFAGPNDTDDPNDYTQGQKYAIVYKISYPSGYDGAIKVAVPSGELYDVVKQYPATKRLHDIEGYQFTGWIYETADGWASYPADGLQIDLSGDASVGVTLYPSWAPVENAGTDRFLVTIELDQTNKEYIYYDKDSTFTLTSPSKDGYRFVNWLNITDKETVTAGTEITVTKDLRFIAQWEEVKAGAHTITYKDGDTVLKTDYVNPNSSYTVYCDASADDAFFAGWKVGDTPYSNGSQIDKVTGDMEFVAQWDAACVIKYTSDGKLMKTDKVRPGETYSVSCDPGTKDGYTFAGWKYEDTIVESIDTSALTRVTLTAEWTQDASSESGTDTIKVVYVVDGEAGTPVTVQKNATVTVAAAPSKEGYLFSGWNDGTNTYAAGAEYQVGDSDVTFTAVFTEDTPASQGLGEEQEQSQNEESSEEHAFGKKILDFVFGEPLYVYADEEALKPVYPYYVIDFAQVTNDGTSFSPQFNNTLQEINEEFRNKYENCSFVERDSDTAVFLSAGLIRKVADGTGNYSFSTSGSGQSYTVLTQDSYGTFHNADLFRKSVFDLTEEECGQFSIKVHSYTSADLNALSQDDLNKVLGAMDMIYLSNGLASGVSVRTEYSDADISVDVRNTVYSTILDMNIPTIVDAAIAFTDVSEEAVEKSKGSIPTNMEQLVMIMLQVNYASYFAEDHTVSFPKTAEEWDSCADGCFAVDSDLNFARDMIVSYYGYYKGGTSIVNSSFAETGLCVNTMSYTGFEEVLSEIEIENQYRAADKLSGYEQLDTGINFGRAIRHAINFTSKRVVTQKSSIRVLEIQPSNAAVGNTWDELTKEKVRTWVNNGIAAENITIDTMTTKEFIGHIDDLNAKYDMIYIGSDISNMNKEGSKVRIENGYPKGEAKYVVLFNFAQNRWDTIDITSKIYNYYEYGCKKDGNYAVQDTNKASTAVLSGNYGNDTLTKTYKNGKVQLNVNEVYRRSIFRFTDNYATIDRGWLDTNATQYFYKEFLEGGEKTVYNDTSMNGLIYANVGDVAYVGTGLTGMLRNEWSWYQLQQGDRMNAWVRYSANDITAEKFNALMDFVDASYPIVVSSELYTTDEKGNRIVNAKTVDNSSYMYDFLNTTLAYGNVVSTTDVEKGSSSAFVFYINREKLKLTITGYGQEATNRNDNSGGAVHYISRNPADNKFYLTYNFNITNEGAVSPNTLYTAKLFLDTNADGKFSQDYEELENVLITTSDGAAVSAAALRAGVNYTMTKELSATYEGVVTWDLQIEQNSNAMIRCEQQGYTKLITNTTPTIRILQIMYNNGNCLNLQESIGREQSTGTSSTFQVYHSLVYGTQGRDVTVRTSNGNETFSVAGNGISDDYNLDITSISIESYMQGYSDGSINLDRDYDMLILGFTDMYGDITGDALYGDNGIIDFIESGKSVLFAHDTTSFWQYSTSGWAYDLNRYIRNYVGMDTYGVTMANTKQVSNWQDYDILMSGTAIKPSDALWKQLYPTKTNGRYNYNAKNIAFKPNSQRTAAVPEVHGFSIQSISRNTTGQYQGAWINDTYYQHLYGFYPGWGVTNNNMNRTTTVTKVNDGQITSYPFKLEDTFQAPQTHMQYYNLDFNADDDNDGETDVVVWYCLNGSDAFYGASYNDTANSYYIYNKGNVTYTGVGDRGNNTSVSEAKLFINTMVAAYNAGTRNIMLSITDKNGKPADVLYEYVDVENDLSFTEDVQRIYFTYSDPNIVKTIKSGAVNFYMTNTGKVDMKEKGTYSVTENGVTYQMKYSVVPFEGKMPNTESVSYTPSFGTTVTAGEKNNYYMRVLDRNGEEAYVKVAELFGDTCMYRCSETGVYPNDANESRGMWYVCCYDWNNHRYVINPLNDVPEYGNCWWEPVQTAYLCKQNSIAARNQGLIEFTNLTVRRKSDDAVVSTEQISLDKYIKQDGEQKAEKDAEQGPLVEDQIYYVEIPLNELRKQGLISYDNSRNELYIAVTPCYTTVNKFTNKAKTVRKNTVYDIVTYASVSIFDLD